MASHCAASTMNPRNDPLHPLFSLRCAEGWSVKADVMKQVLRKHAHVTESDMNRPCHDASGPGRSADLVPLVHLRVVERLNHDPVVHLGNTWRIRSRALG